MKNILTTFLLFSIIFLGKSLFAQSWGDYTFYSIQNTQLGYLLRNDNTIYHTWNFGSSNKTGYSAYVLPGGILLRSVYYTPNSFSGGGQTGKIQKVDMNGNILWDFVYSTTAYGAHHDICPMPNGNVLLIAYEAKTAAQATQAGSLSAIVIWSEKIVEVKQTGPTTGEVVWEWKLWDHLVQNVDPVKDNYRPSIANSPERLNINYKTSKDWIHMNGIDYNPILDQIVVSSHNLNEIYVIDHSTTTAEAAGSTGGNAGKGGDFLFRWGNPAAYQRSGATIFNVVHDAHWIPEGVPNAGRLVAFNNKGISSTRSSIDQIIPPRNDYNYTLMGTSAYLPATYDDRLACNGYSSNMSNSMQLPNGNTLVCMATSGLIYETNAAGTTIWQKQATGSVAQASRYSHCYISNPAPAIPEITRIGDTLVASSALTYQWYRNGNLIGEAKSQKYVPTQPGIFVVRVTDQSECHYSYSKGLRVDLATSMNWLATTENIRVFPNPASDYVQIKADNLEVKTVTMFSLAGAIVQKTFNETYLDVTGVQNGVYFIKIETNAGALTRKIVVNRN